MVDIRSENFTRLLGYVSDLNRFVQHLCKMKVSGKKFGVCIVAGYFLHHSELAHHYGQSTNKKTFLSPLFDFQINRRF